MSKLKAVLMKMALGLVVIVPQFGAAGMTGGYDTRGGLVPLALPGSALAEARAAVKVDWSPVPAYSSEAIRAGFAFARDTHYLPQSSGPLRRIPFLYPDDGCLTRAALTNELLNQKSITTVRLFLFGKLHLQSANALTPDIGFWFHTAPAVKNESGEILVFDISLDPNGPMPLNEWIMRLQPEKSEYRISVCHPDTHEPTDSCGAGRSNVLEAAHIEVQGLLTQEWNRLLKLNRDPIRWLGLRDSSVD